MEHELFRTNLEARVINREGDEDFFIPTDLYPLDVMLEIPGMSRIQFPSSKWVTIHILRDMDLFSSFANFELNLEKRRLSIQKEEGYIIMKFEA